MEKVRVSSKEVASRSIVARLWPGSDLITGLLEICSLHDIEAGCITAMHGSLGSARFVWALRDTTKKMNARYGDPMTLEGPLEFLCGSGMIGRSAEDERVNIHLHGVLSDQFQNLYGAHFLQGENPVMSTMEVCIQAFEGLKILRAFDDETEFPLFNIY